MTPPAPPRWPFTTPADALEAHLAGTFWPRLRRWADHMDQWLNTQRPPIGDQETRREAA